MRIRFLGTAAAEGWPGVFCECDACRRAVRLGGKDIRTRTSLQINDDCKIDLPPDTYLHLLKYGLELTRLRHLLITHAHLDHLEPGNLALRGPGFSKRRSSEPLHVYGNDRVFEWIQRAGMHPRDELGIECHRVEPGRAFQAGRLDVLPLPADHATDQVPMMYVLQEQNVRVWQAFDTGYPPAAAWDLVRDLQFDAVIMDCTAGPLTTSGRGHMAIEHVAAMKTELAGRGQLRPGCRCIATHFSHAGGYTHAELEQALGKHGIEVAYDGMVASIAKPA